MATRVCTACKATLANDVFVGKLNRECKTCKNCRDRATEKRHDKVKIQKAQLAVLAASIAATPVASASTTPVASASTAPVASIVSQKIANGLIPCYRCHAGKTHAELGYNTKKQMYKICTACRNKAGSKARPTVEIKTESKMETKMETNAEIKTESRVEPKKAPLINNAEIKTESRVEPKKAPLIKVYQMIDNWRVRICANTSPISTKLAIVSTWTNHVARRIGMLKGTRMSDTPSIRTQKDAEIRTLSATLAEMVAVHNSFLNELSRNDSPSRTPQLVAPPSTPITDAAGAPAAVSPSMLNAQLSAVNPTISIADPSVSPLVDPIAPIVDQAASIINPIAPVVDQAASIINPIAHVVDQAASTISPSVSPVVIKTSPIVSPSVSPAADQTASIVNPPKPSIVNPVKMSINDQIATVMAKSTRPKKPVSARIKFYANRTKLTNVKSALAVLTEYMTTHTLTDDIKGTYVRDIEKLTLRAKELNVEGRQLHELYQEEERHPYVPTPDELIEDERENKRKTIKEILRMMNEEPWLGRCAWTFNGKTQYISLETLVPMTGNDLCDFMYDLSCASNDKKRKFANNNDSDSSDEE